MSKLVKLDSIKRDVQKEEAGDWIPVDPILFPKFPGIEFHVKSQRCKAFQTARSEAIRLLAQKFGTKPIPRDEEEKEIAKLYHQHVLIDWRGFSEPYTKELGAMIHEQLREYSDLMAAIQWASSQVGEREVEFVEVTIKN